MEWGEIKEILFIGVLASNLFIMFFTVLIPLIAAIFFKRNWWKKIKNKDQNKKEDIDQEIKKYDLKIKKLQLQNLQKENLESKNN